MNDSEQEEQATEYANRRAIMVQFDEQFGHGTDGRVWKTSRLTALKSFYREATYFVERDCYLRIQSRQIVKIINFHVPQLKDYDDDLRIIEMSIVSPPFLLDFGKCYLDHPPDYSEDVLEEDEQYRRELFEDRWPEVQRLLWKLESIGIYYMDARPGNITFE